MTTQSSIRNASIEKYQNYMRRLDVWERNENERLRTSILVPVFYGNMCIMHNSMIAYESGKPWQEVGPREYKLGKYFNWKQEQIWSTYRRLNQSFYDKLIAAYRLPV